MIRKYWQYKKKTKTENIAHIKNLLQTSKEKQTNKQIGKKCTKVIINVMSKRKKESTKVRKYA